MPHPRLRARLDAAIKAAAHITDKDAAAVQLARSLASAIDQAYADDPDGSTYRKYAGWISPNYLNALRALGLTPDSTDKAGAGGPAAPVTTLARLRGDRAQLRAVDGIE